MENFARVSAHVGKAAVPSRLVRGVLRMLVAMGLLWATAPAVHAAAPCCAITGVNAAAGTVTARVNSNGQTFTFRLQNRRLAMRLRAGQPVYANFRKRQVSLDGRSIAGTITAIGAAPAPRGIPARPAPAPPAPSRGIPARPASAPPAPSKGPAACCAITAVNGVAGTVTARVNANGQTFTFRLQNPRLAMRLRAGQPVYANFRKRQVSLDGRSIAGAIIAIGATSASRGLPQKPAAASQAPGNQAAAAPNRTVAPRSSPQRTPAPATGFGRPSAGLSAAGHPHPITMALPQVAAGTPQPAQSSSGRHTMTRAIGGSHQMVLHGISGIKSATSLPQGVRDFLLMHAKALPPDQVDNYIVNVPLAEEWLKTHPEPEAVRKAAAKGDGHTGCNSLSVHCAGEAAKHAEDEASRQSQRALQAAQKEWNHVTAEAAHDWNMTQQCFADQTLHLRNVPVQFAVTPQFPLSFEKSGHSTNKYGGASGDIKGTVAFGLPVDADFRADVDMFYIPCLPFAIRPRSIAADGAMTLGSTFEATVNASGQFAESFTIPPTGGPHFPIEVIPIVIAGVPVAEMDVSLYVDGTVDVDGKGNLNGNLKLAASQKTAFAFQCSGKGCQVKNHNIPVPATASESVQVDGRIHVKPAIYVALQLDFDVDVLSARAGPQPYLLGEIYGCSATSASQSSSGQSSAQELYALTADLDWGIELRAEALAGAQKLGEIKKPLLNPRHLYFKDLAHSTALLPALAGTVQPASGQPAGYQLAMPKCYPYSDQIEYQVQWTGGATSASTAGAKTQQRAKVASLLSRGSHSAQPSNCTLQPGRAICWGDPHKPVALDLVWPQAGNYTVTVSPVQDKHGRKFAEPGTQLNVNVQ